jgi:hypothetical protein
MMDWTKVVADRKVYVAVGGTSAATAHDAYGQAFVSLTSGGVKPEGDPMPRWFQSEHEARAAYCRELAEFISDKPEVYFRKQPEIVSEDGKYVVYSRLTVH